MRRRDFIKVIAGSAASWPLAAWAQGSQKVRRVSLLIGLDESDPIMKARIRAFRLGMRDLGWIEGSNVEIEYRFTGTDAKSINGHVGEVIRLAPDVIVANTTPVMAALRPATSTIPIIFAVVIDPVVKDSFQAFHILEAISPGSRSSSPKSLVNGLACLATSNPICRA